MGTVILVVSWVLWAVVLLYGFTMAIYRRRDWQLQWIMRKRGWITILSCAIVAVLKVSKFWIIVAVPVMIFVPRLMMLVWLAITADGRLKALINESERTGIPIDKLYEDKNRQREVDYLIENLERESKATGVPLDELMKRELEKMEEEFRQKYGLW